jgi:hypothetical protein
MGARTDDRRGILEVAPAPVRTLVAIRWRIAGAAMRARHAQLNLGAVDADASLCIRLELEDGPTSGRVAGARASLETRQRADCPIERAGRGGTWSRDGSLVHIDVPDLVSATIRVAHAETMLLYARTPLLGELGFAPGAYEPAGCESGL